MSVVTAVAIGGMAYEASQGSGGGGVTASAPAPQETAQQITQGQINEAPQLLQLAQSQDPQYQALQSQLLNQSIFGGNGQQGLLQTYKQAAPQLQQIQSQANAQQAGANIGLVNQYAPQALAAYQAANPQLTKLQGQLTNLAMTPQNPVSQMSGAGGWSQGFAQQVGQGVQGAQIQAPTSQSAAGMLGGFQPNVQQIGGASLGWDPTGHNSTNAVLQNTAQQQLALGTQVSPQEQATVANSVLSNYNQQGRANDPTAIAGLATGLDTYGQQLLNTREANAANAAQLQTGQQALGLQARTTQAGLGQTAQLANQQTALSGSGLGLSALTSGAGLQQQTNLANQGANLTAQQSNLAALLQSLGLQGSALQAGGQQQLQQGAYNQQAQLQNAQYQSGLLTTAANLAQQTAINPYSLILGQSGALGNAMGTASAAGQGNGAATGLANQYNPFNTQLMSQMTQSGTQASLANQNVNAGALGGLMSGYGSYMGGAASQAGGWASLLGMLG